MKSKSIIFILFFISTKLLYSDTYVINKDFVNVLFPQLEAGLNISESESSLITEMLQEKLLNSGNFKLIETNRSYEELKQINYADINADFLFLGRIENKNNFISISIRIIHIKTKEHIIAEEYESSVEDFNEIMDTIVFEISSEMVLLRYGITLDNISLLIKRREYDKAEYFLDTFISQNGTNEKTLTNKEILYKKKAAELKKSIEQNIKHDFIDKAILELPLYLIYSGDMADRDFILNSYEKLSKKRKKELNNFEKSIKKKIKHETPEAAIDSIHKHISQYGYEGREVNYKELEQKANKKGFESSLSSAKFNVKLNKLTEGRYHLQKASDYKITDKALVETLEKYDNQLEDNILRDNKKAEKKKIFEPVVYEGNRYTLEAGTLILSDPEYKTYSKGNFGNYSFLIRKYTPIVPPLHRILEGSMSYASGQNNMDTGSAMSSFSFNSFDLGLSGGYALSFNKMEFSFLLFSQPGWFYREDDIDKINTASIAFGLGLEIDFNLFENYSINLFYKPSKRFVIGSGFINQTRFGIGSSLKF